MKSTRWTFLAGLTVVGSLLLSACGTDQNAATSVSNAGNGAATAVTGAGNGAATAAMGAGDAAATAAAAAGTAAAGAGNGAATAVTGGGNNAATAVTGAGNGAATAVTGAGTAVTGAMGGTFDPTKVKKLTVENGATIRISTWGDTSEQAVNRAMLDRFKQVYPNITVTYEPQPDNYTTKLKAQISGKTEPDVFYVEPSASSEFVDANVLQDLTPALTEEGMSADNYIPSLIAIFSRNGKIYGLPKDFGSLAVFYNTDMVSKMNAAPPKDGWTQADFRTFAKTLTQGTDPSTKIFGTDAPPQSQRWLPFAFANGAKLLDSTNKKCMINSAEGVSSLDYWYGMWKDKIAADPKPDTGSDWEGVAFGKQRIASAISGGWLVPFMAKPENGYTGVKYDVAPLPVGTAGKGNLLFTNAYAASARSKFPKAAAALVAFLAGPDNQEAVLQTGFALPTLKGFDNDAFFKGTGVANHADAILYAAGTYGTVDYYGPATDAIHKALDDAMTRVNAGSQTTKAALDQACQEIDSSMTP
ncbi:MAG: ABC transporter substrate-binding protein [Chloroflexia bacterium]